MQCKEPEYDSDVYLEKERSVRFFLSQLKNVRWLNYLFRFIDCYNPVICQALFCTCHINIFLFSLQPVNWNLHISLLPRCFIFLIDGCESLWSSDLSCFSVGLSDDITQLDEDQQIHSFGAEKQLKDSLAEDVLLRNSSCCGPLEPEEQRQGANVYANRGCDLKSPWSDSC